MAVRASNVGGAPTDTALAAKRRLRRRRAGRASRRRPGVEVLAGPAVGDAGRLEAGAVAAQPVRWLVHVTAAGPLGTVVVAHPKADDARAEVKTP